MGQGLVGSGPCGTTAPVCRGLAASQLDLFKTAAPAPTTETARPLGAATQVRLSAATSAKEQGNSMVTTGIVASRQTNTAVHSAIAARGRRWCRGCLVLLAPLCVWAGAVCQPSVAAPPPASYYGANIQPLIRETLVPPSGWNTFIAAMSDDHLETARMDAIWSWAEPNPPVNGVHTYTWDSPGDPTHSTDALVGMLAANGIRMVAVLDSPPAWTGSTGFHLSPDYYGDFVAYATAFAARYGAGGTFWAQNPQLPYLPVQQFEVWTEANSTNFWTGSPDPAEYLKVLQPLHAALHAVDPTGQVLASIGWENAASYVSQLYALGVKGSIDGIGFHPYAANTPAIVGLTQQLRSTLAAAGDGDLPIYITEAGQPAVPASPGDTSEDAARAAMLSLTGDALARSDCGVQSFDIYGLIGSGTALEPIDEGYMGILDDVTGAPNLTGSAIIAASERWQTDPASGIVLCGAGSTPPADLLPLGLSVTHTTPTCVSATATYGGYPLEAAQLVLRTADGRVDPATTSPSGRAQMCLQNGSAVTDFTAYAELSAPITTASFVTPNIARSPTFICRVSATSTPPCTQEADTGTDGTYGPGDGSADSGVAGASGIAGSIRPTKSRLASATTCRLSAKVVKVTAKRATLRARITCRHGQSPRAKLQVSLRRRGRRKLTPLTRVTLAAKGRWRTFTVRAELHVGDRIRATVAANKRARQPAMQVYLTATRKLLRAARPRRRY